MPVDDAGRNPLDGHELIGLDGALAVSGLAEGVDNAAQHRLSRGDLDDSPGPFDDIALFDRLVLSEQDRSDLPLFEVESEPEGSLVEVEEFACHHLLQAVHLGNAVSHLGDIPNLGNCHAEIEVFDLLANDGTDLVCSDFICHCLLPFCFQAVAHPPPKTGKKSEVSRPRIQHLLPKLCQLIADGSVIHGTANSRNQSPENRGVDLEMEADRAASRGGELLLERVALLLAKVPGRDDLRRNDAGTSVQFTMDRLQHRIELMQPAIGQEKPEEIGRRRLEREAVEEGLQHAAFAFEGNRRIGKDVAEFLVATQQTGKLRQIGDDRLHLPTLNRHVHQRAGISIGNRRVTHNLPVWAA